VRLDQGVGRALDSAGHAQRAQQVPHETRAFPIWHFDFYRFDDPREWEDAGFRDVFDQPGLKLAEWPEKAAGLLPAADLTLHLTVDPDGSRSVRVDPGSDIGRELAA
jgi:tRNA threonylcarbamoyladenosine biosynthesis protein TsaE